LPFPIYAYELVCGMLLETVSLLLREPFVISNIRESRKFKPKNLKKYEELVA